MKSLYESLLDDFDNLESKQDTALRNELLKGTWFRLGSDMKTIIFEPEENTSGRDRNTTPRLYWVDGKNYETSLSDVGVCKNLGLKFQPLAYVSDEIIGKDDDWLKYFDCEYVVTFIYSVQSGTRPTIDMSKIKFPIIGKVAFTGYSTIDKIIAYPKPLEMVRFLVQVRQPITGWKCKHMIIDNASNIMFDLVGHNLDASLEEKEQKLIEWVDELLKNNPDTETIYLSQFNRYTDHVKVVTKGQGANRKCVKLAKFPDSKFRTMCHKNPTIDKMNNDVEAWRWQHADLYECECAPAAAGAVTPGNTLGMGNPMAPSGDTPGTEPVIPKYPRNKKKRKSLKESLLDDFDTMSDFQDLSIILDDPNFNKNNFNKLKRLFKKAGGGEEYTKGDDKNETTYFICFDRGGLNNTSEVKVGIPDKAPTLTRTYFPGYRYVYDAKGTVQLHPHIWAIHAKVPAKNHFWRNTAGPISIPDKYVPYFERLIQNAPEYGSKEFFELTDKRKKW